MGLTLVCLLYVESYRFKGVIKVHARYNCLFGYYVEESEKDNDHLKNCKKLTFLLFYARAFRPFNKAALS